VAVQGVGVRFVESTQKRRDDRATEARRRTDAQAATGRAVSQLAHLFQCLNDSLDARMAMLIEEFAFARERCAARRPQEKPRVELCFELLNVTADGGSADAEAVARLREAAFARHGKESDHACVARRETAGERIIAGRRRRKLSD